MNVDWKSINDCQMLERIEMQIRKVVVFASLSLSFVCTYGADILADDFGVRFGCSVDQVIDASFLDVKVENGFIRHSLNGCKFLYQRSLLGFVVDELYSSKGDGKIAGFSATRRVGGKREAERYKAWLMKRIPGIKAFRGENDMPYYQYTTDENEQRILFLRFSSNGHSTYLSIVVYSADLINRIIRREQDKYNDACVTLSTDTGVAGSGVLIDDDGDLYLYTNRHVIESGKEISATLQSGGTLLLGNLAVSKTLDLARFRVKSSASGLKLAKDLPRIGDTIVVLGNSLGAGAITRANGKVLGVGGNIIEVDADFVSGNSGGPIINQHGEVVGIATFVTKASDKIDWIVKGTRYEKARRFGLRPFANDWENVSLKLLNQQYTLMIDSATFTVLLSLTPFVLGDEYPLKKLEVDFSKLNNSGISLEVLARYKRLVQCYNSLQQRLQERADLENRLMKYLRVSGDITIPCRHSKHGDKQSVLYKIDDGFEIMCLEFCAKHRIKTERGSATIDTLNEIAKVQSKVVMKHKEYKKLIDKELRDTKGKLTRSAEGVCYANEAHQLIELLDRFKELARDNKYK